MEERKPLLMDTERMEGFSDGVLAIIITITALSMRAPLTDSFADLRGMLPLLLTYAWSFHTIGTYWNNHHHLMRATKGVTSSIMWSNLLLLFWLSLIPFATEWLGNHLASSWPTATYCAILLFTALSYTLLEWCIVSHQGNRSLLGMAIAKDKKEWISLIAYTLAVCFAFLSPWLSYLLVVSVSALWFIPDRRLVRTPNA